MPPCSNACTNGTNTADAEVTARRVLSPGSRRGHRCMLLMCALDSLTAPHKHLRQLDVPHGRVMSLVKGGTDGGRGRGRGGGGKGVEAGDKGGK